jgi:hypothetical protein
VGLLDNTVVPFLTFWRTSILFPIIAVWIYISTKTSRYPINMYNFYGFTYQLKNTNSILKRYTLPVNQQKVEWGRKGLAQLCSKTEPTVLPLSSDFYLPELCNEWNTFLLLQVIQFLVFWLFPPHFVHLKLTQNWYGNTGNWYKLCGKITTMKAKVLWD